MSDDQEIKVGIWTDLTKPFPSEAGHFFDFTQHRWTDDYLTLTGQPILSSKTEWHGSQRHGGWGKVYCLYNGQNMVETTRLTKLREAVRTYLTGILLYEDGTLDAPPATWERIKPYYVPDIKRLRFGSETKLHQFITFMWGLDAVNLIGKGGRIVKPQTLHDKPRIDVDARIESLVDAAEKSGNNAQKT